MPLQEIQRSEWPFLFDSFNRQHEGWLTTVEVVAPDGSVQVVAQRLAFEGLSYDLKGSDKDSLSVDLAETPSAHMVHTMARPLGVRLQTNAEGAHEAMEIVCADGTTTRVRFRVAVLPEMVDGLVLETT